MRVLKFKHRFTMDDPVVHIVQVIKNSYKYI